MEVILYIFYVVILILLVIGCFCIGYDFGCKNTEQAYKNKECDKCSNYKTQHCPNISQCYRSLNKPYFKV